MLNIKYIKNSLDIVLELKFKEILLIIIILIALTGIIPFTEVIALFK